MKTCKRCEKEQEDEQYYVKYQPTVCKSCIRKYQRVFKNESKSKDEYAMNRIAKGMSTAEEFKWQIREDERDLIMRDFLKIASGEKL